MGRVGDDAVAVLAVRGEHAVGSGEMGAGAWHRASSRSERHFRGGEAGDAQSAGLPICTAGGCPEGGRHTDVPHEFDGVEHDMGGAVPEGVLESIHDLRAVVDREAFVGDGRAGDVAAQAFEGVPVMGFAPGICMERENPESWARQGWSGGGLEPTVRSVRALRPAWGPVAMRSWTAAPRSCSKSSAGSMVEGGGLVIAAQQSLLLQGAGDAGGDGVEQALEFGLGLGAATRWNRGASSSNA